MRVMAVWTPKSCGLENIGDSCYMNAGLQCLLATTELTHMFVRGLYSQHLNVSNKDGCKGSGSQSGQLAEAFNLLVDQTHTHSARGPASCVPWQHVGTAVVPSFMKRILGQFNTNFADFGQHDGQEVLGTLLDGLHEDLNGVTIKPITANPVGDGSNDEEVALLEQSWYKQRHDSFVADTFQGELLNRVTCPGCATQSVTFDPSIRGTANMQLQRFVSNAPEPIFIGPDKDVGAIARNQVGAMGLARLGAQAQGVSSHHCHGFSHDKVAVRLSKVPNCLSASNCPLRRFALLWRWRRYRNKQDLKIFLARVSS